MFGRKEPEVLVVGAGPVGLMTALMLARRGVAVQIVDKEGRTAAHAYALALHASSLPLLEEAGILSAVLAQAYRVRTVGLYDGAKRRAELRTSQLEADFSFLAVIRQDVLEGLLEDALRREGVRVRWNHHMAHLSQQTDHVHVLVDRLEKGSAGYGVAHTEWHVGSTKTLDVPFVVGTDGHASDVRAALGLDYPSFGPPTYYAIYEFETDLDLDHEMRLVLDDGTTNVLWPLPGGGARWSFQLLDFEDTSAPRRKDRDLLQFTGHRSQLLSEALLRRLIKERAPWFTASIDAVEWRLVVRFENHLVGAFGQDGTWLAGDAAHMTGPIGIQSMNVGLREAHDLAAILAAVLQEGAPRTLLTAYNSQRQTEWRFLLGLDGGLTVGSPATPWVTQRAQRLLSCLPASGVHLTALAHQLGLETRTAPALA